MAFKQAQLAKLVALPAPGGVDRALWLVLTKHLADLLTGQDKVALTAPTTPASAPRLVLDPVAHTLSWGYSMQGDYDQNGEVNVADLQPLGVHFSQSSGGGPFPLDGVQAIVDGDSNGEINIADLQPIGANFGRQCGQFQIYSSTSFADYPPTPNAPNGAGAVLVGTVTHDEATGVANQARLQFSYNIPAFAPGTFYWIRPSDGSADGTPSNAVSAGAAANQPPVAVIIATGPSGEAPLTVNFDASASSDPDGATHTIADIVQFQWDFDGDGSFDLTTSAPTLSHTYQNAGTYSATVRVTDAGGAATTALPVAIHATVNGNLPPVPALSADKTFGHAAYEVIFDASGTTDDAGTSGLDYDWDYNGDGIDDFDSGNIPAASHTYSTPGTYLARVRVTDVEGLTAQETVSIAVASVLANLPPMAKFTATNSYGGAPLTTTFDFSPSNDPDGHIVLYEFDYQGDGTYDINSTTSPAGVQYQYVTAGIYYAKLRVTDDEGATSTYELPVEANTGAGSATTLQKSITPTSGPAPLDVTFDFTGSTAVPNGIIDYGIDFDGDGHVDAHGPNPVYHYSYPNAGTYNPIIWLCDGNGWGQVGFGLPPITVTHPGNLPPTAQLTSIPGSTTYPQTVTLDASGSTDPDGHIVKYEWDWDGDGTFDYDSGALSYVTHRFVQIGSFTPKVRVTDNDGATDTANATPVTVTAGWHTVPLNYYILHGYASVAIEQYSTGTLHQRVFAAWGDASAAYVPLVLTSDEDQLDHWSTLALNVGTEKCAGALSLMPINGLPELFYQRVGASGTGGLSYIRATDVAGSAWTTPVNIDNNGQNVATVVCSAPVGTRPAVAVLDAATQTVKFARASNLLGTAWPALTVAATGFTYEPGGMGLVDLSGDTPAVAINTNSFGSPYVADNFFEFATDVNGTSWWPNLVHLQGPYTNYSAADNTMGCALVDGDPAVVFDGANGQLLFARSSSVYGQAWSTPTVIDTIPGFGSRHNYITLLVVNGRPMVICQRNGTDVVAIEAKDAQGVTWQTLDYIDSVGDVGEGCSAVTDGSTVAVAYLDATNHGEKVAVR